MINPNEMARKVPNAGPINNSAILAITLPPRAQGYRSIFPASGIV